MLRRIGRALAELLGLRRLCYGCHLHGTNCVGLCLDDE